MRKVCRDCFGPVASGTCPTCDKFIQVNLGKHVALYHLDLAQLWRCPVDWCPVWKGTSQDCVDHMRRAHNTPISVKAGNLACWFPPWTVTREQWHGMSRPSVSGIAIDTFLFSRIGMPLFHRYRVFDRLGSHPAFWGPYMPRLFTFLKDSDADSIRRSHRRRAKEIGTSMSKRTSSIREVPAATSSLQRSVQSTPVSTITGRESGPSLVPMAWQSPACVGKIYLQSVGGGRYSTSTDGLVIATVYQARRRRDSEDRAVAGNREFAGIPGVSEGRIPGDYELTLYDAG